MDKVYLQLLLQISHKMQIETTHNRILKMDKTSQRRLQELLQVRVDQDPQTGRGTSCRLKDLVHLCMSKARMKYQTKRLW